jgi:hypothetical protein
MTISADSAIRRNGLLALTSDSFSVHALSVRGHAENASRLGFLAIPAEELDQGIARTRTAIRIIGSGKLEQRIRERGGSGGHPSTP